jgi:hypothetical protein
MRLFSFAGAPELGSTFSALQDEIDVLARSDPELAGHAR